MTFVRANACAFANALAIATGSFMPFVSALALANAYADANEFSVNPKGAE